MLSVDMIIACFEWGGPFSLRSVDTAVLEVRRATWIEYDNSSVAKQNICLSHNTASCTRCTCWYNFWQGSHSWQEEGIQNRDITCGSHSVIGAVHTTGKYLELKFVGAVRMTPWRAKLSLTNASVLSMYCVWCMSPLVLLNWHFWQLWVEPWHLDLCFKHQVSSNCLSCPGNDLSLESGQSSPWC